MKQSLLFLPDISGFTQFVNNTEIEHSQHVIAELLEILINANTLNLTLAEIEGDALFFYTEEIPTAAALLEQMEKMLTVFHEHLHLLKTNRICPCNACASAPDLELKIIAHSGPLQFITVQDNKKPFGPQVIEAHRLMKNSVESDNYVLLSEELFNQLKIDHSSHSIFKFRQGSNLYDGKEVHYCYAVVNPDDLPTSDPRKSQNVTFNRAPNFTYQTEMPINAEALYEYISNFAYRTYWVDGVDSLIYDEKPVNRTGIEHACIVNGSHLNFVTVTKPVAQGQLVYGEMTESPPPVDRIYQFYVIDPINSERSHLTIESFWEGKSVIKRILGALVVKSFVRKNIVKTVGLLKRFIERSTATPEKIAP